MLISLSAVSDVIHSSVTHKETREALTQQVNTLILALNAEAGRLTFRGRGANNESNDNFVEALRQILDAATNRKPPGVDSRSTPSVKKAQAETERQQK